MDSSGISEPLKLVEVLDLAEELGEAVDALQMNSVGVPPLQDVESGWSLLS